MKLRCKICKTYYNQRFFTETSEEVGHCFSCNTINSMIKSFAKALSLGTLGKKSIEHFKEKLNSITY